MKRTIRKTPAGVSVSYKSGDFSNNLMGADFVLEDVEGECEICRSHLGQTRLGRRRPASSFARAVIRIAGPAHGGVVVGLQRERVTASERAEELCWRGLAEHAGVDGPIPHSVAA